jgi:hypothetical protein
MNSTRTAVAALLAAAVLGFGVAPASAQKKSKADRSCLAIAIGSKQKLSDKGKDDNEREFDKELGAFSATAVLDIDFAIVFSPQVAAQFTNVHVIEFRILTPQGNLYESISVPITSDPSKAGQKHRVAGYPDLIPVQVLQSITRGGGKGMLAKVTLPVAGTPIVSNSLYGTWTALALVEDEIVPCSTPARFTISQ